MEAAKSVFSLELTNLEHLISYYELESKLMGNFIFQNPSAEEQFLKSLSDKLKSFSTSKRQFNYNSIIISLYGSFEKFIEGCILGYVDKLNNIVSRYMDLPETIIRNHFLLSLTLLNKVEQSRYNGSLNKETIISNLHTCLNTVGNYNLNIEAFSQHTANFRTQVVDDSFKSTGINSVSQKIIHQRDFREYITNKLGRQFTDVLTVEESFQYLNSLADLRNEVAHGVSNTIISNQILLDYIEFFKEYASGLVETLNKEIIFFEFSEYAIPLGKMTDTFKDGEIICVFTNKIPIKVGDVLIGKSASNIIKSKILEIKLNENNVDETDDKDDYEIGIKLDTKFKKNFKIFLSEPN